MRRLLAGVLLSVSATSVSLAWPDEPLPAWGNNEAPPHESRRHAWENPAPGRFAAGYENMPALRWWFAHGYGLDVLGTYSRDKSSDEDNAILPADRYTYDTKSWGYEIVVGVARRVKWGEIVDLNFLLRVSHEHFYLRREFGSSLLSAPFSDFATFKRRTYGVHVGPEIEVKVPYLKGLVLSAAILGEFRLDKTRESATGTVPGGDHVARGRSSAFRVTSGGFTLNTLRLRYYF